MKRWWLSGGVRLWFLLISGCLSVIAIEPGWAEVKPIVEQQEVQSQEIKPLLSEKIRQLSELEHPSTSAQMLVQSPAPRNPSSVPPYQGGKQGGVIQVTGVQANTTDKGLEVILQTTQGQQLQISDRSTGNNFIADIPNAQLRLSNGDAFTFSSQDPVEGITEITVTNLDANTIRVTVAGETGLPTVELFDSNEGLILGLTPATTAMQPQQPEGEQPTSETPQETPAAQQDDLIEILVTGQQDTGYRVPDASTATRTDTPLRDIPQSIQVVPQEVLRDRQVRNVNEALRNIPGGSQGNLSASRSANIRFNIRGFDAQFDTLRNGLKDPISYASGVNTANIEQIEVLKGPASVLYGQGSLGGIVNYVTKQPLSEPYYSLEAAAGSFNFYSGALDLSGPLNDSRTVLYRLNLAALTTESFVDFYDEQQYFVAPVLAWQISDRTRLTLEAEYLARPKTFAQTGLPVEGTILPNPNGRIPRNRSISGPDTQDNTYSIRAGYNLEHQLSENWQIRNAFRFSRYNSQREAIGFNGLAADQRTAQRYYQDYDNDDEFTNYFNVDTYVVGEFATGSIRHQLVTGFNLSHRRDSQTGVFGEAAPIDVFNPVYDQSRGEVTFPYDNLFLTDVLGIYVQDQVTLVDNLKLLLGLRFDTFSQTTTDRLADTEVGLSGNAFSPRAGIVYQPIEPISLYASYSRAFNPVTGTSFEGDAFQPERGTQYEVGVKADLNDQLSATLAFYNLTRSNVLTEDTRPGVPPGQFSIQTGEQRSRGFELSLGGEILPGWNIIAGYAYTDAQITQDNFLPVGDRLTRIPQNTFNLWTTYEIQQGSLQGLGFGLGFLFVGEREGELPNTVLKIPSYFTTDAAIFYRRDRFRAALNIKNLFDIDYFETGSAFDVFYGEPLTVQGTISWEF